MFALLAFLSFSVCVHGFLATKTMSRLAPSSLRMSSGALPEYLLELGNGAKAICRTYGGNCFSYITKDGIEVMGTRADAPNPIADTKPYAGGSPHCFPQFGPGALMQHGFARGMKFIPGARAKEATFDRINFKLVPTEDTLAVWNHKFVYSFDITLREEFLEWDLSVVNEGDAPFDITTGMHTYFDVSSLANVVISGPFTGAPTVDKVTGETGTATSDDITITSHVDKLYSGVTGPVTITDTGKGTKVTMERKGYSDTVLWSPFGNEAMGFDKFVCVEPVSASPVIIAPGTETKFNQKISCVKI